MHLVAKTLLQIAIFNFRESRRSGLHRTYCSPKGASTRVWSQMTESAHAAGELLHTMDIKEAESDADIARCLPAVRELRTYLKEDSSKFVERVQQQRAKGYHLVYLEDQGKIQAIAGYRIRDNLETSSPRYMYVADLLSMPTERSKGYGKHIFSYLEDTAREAGCKRLLLESNLERERAHKFYEREGLTKTAYRFAKNL